ncbi:MAG: S-layer homology domain-containing protein [Oscillospiraceae bacterium]|nr:S-layer homology domain-containing protein [Oscillospiraceae bacterium]
MKQLKKFTALVIAMSMALSAIPTITFSVHAAAEFVGASGGDGTEGNPYTISNCAELEAFRDYINDGNTGESKHFKLTADIDMSEKYNEDGESWTPIGYYNGSSDYNPFNGTFDGNEYKITGLYFNSTSDYQGLFGYIEEDGVIKNLGVSGSVACRNYAGGIAGLNSGTIENSYNTGDVTAIYDYGAAGGIAGYNNGNIENSYNTGNVSGDTAGGIAGFSLGAIESCYNTGSVMGVGSSGSVGGLVGNGYYCTMKNCYNTGDVMGLDASYVGGIVGQHSYETIENCYNTGSVSGSNKVGGVFGRIYDCTVRNCYYLQKDEINAGMSAVGEKISSTTINVESKTADEFKSLASTLGSDAWKDSDWFKRPVLVSNPEVIEIPDLDTLEKVRDYINDDNGDSEYFKLTANIVMSEKYNEDGESWTPIGTNGSKYFRGTFDGDGHTITGLYINSASGVQGLFGYMGAYQDNRGTIKNLGVVNVSVTASGDYVGIIAGSSYGTIENCYSNGSVSGSYSVGGIVGWNSGTVTNCYNTGNVTAINEESISYAGGIVGEASAAEMTNCYNTGTVTGSTVGGIIGKVFNTSTVTNSYYLNTCVENGNNYGTSKIVDEFNSGEVAWALQNGQVALAWGQILETDEYPILTSETAKKVLKVTFVKDDRNKEYRYTNMNGKVTDIPEAPEGYVWSDFDENTQITGDTTVTAVSTATPTLTVEPTATPTIEPTATPTAEPTATSTPDATATSTPDVTATSTPDVTATSTPDATATSTPDVTATSTPDVTATSTPDVTATSTPDVTATSTPDVTATSTPDVTATSTPDVTATSTPDVTATSTPDVTATSTPDVTATSTPDVTATSTPDVTVTPTATPTAVPTVTSSPSPTPEVTPTPSPSPTPTAKPKKSGGSSSKPASTPKPSPTATPDTVTAETPTPTVTADPTVTAKPADNTNEADSSSVWFTDVPDNLWFYEPIKYTLRRGLMSGITNTIFEPETDVTRAMFVCVLYRIEGEPETNYAMTFEDVSPNMYYAEEVAWAAENNIVSGYSDKVFDPDGLITREQMAAIMYRYANFKEYDTNTGAALNYADKESVSDYAVSAVIWTTENGIMSGYENYFTPHNYATRAQTASVFRQFDEKFNLK